MPHFYLQLTFFSAAIGVAVLAGGMIPLLLHWTRAHLPALLSLSGGIMLGAALLHLLPEAYAVVGARSGIWILAGFVFLYAFEKFFTVHICEALSCEVHSVGMAAFIGMAIHTLTDGVALGAGMSMDGVGWIVFLSIFLHKLPSAFALTSILLHSEYRQRTIVLLQGIFFLMVPLGALLVHFLFAVSDASLLGRTIGFSTGTFLHISLSDIIPEVHRSHYQRGLAFAAFLAGLILMALLKYGTPL